MNGFVFESLPGRVVFGLGALDQLPSEVERLGARRALVLSTPQQQALAENVAARFGERSAGIFPEAVMHVPVEVAGRARDEAERVRRRLRRGGRWRIDDRPRQSDRPAFQPSDPGGPHHLCRLGDDARSMG